jgi:dipeptidyl aminopeptidase/acylaminoacyl peptidase
VVIAIVAVALGCAPGPLGAQEAPFSSLARRAFANILKIPLADPEVSVTVRGTKEEDGIVIEDITWESLDGQHPIAYVMYPAGASGRLPAILFGHGSSGSRESGVGKNVRGWTMD